MAVYIGTLDVVNLVNLFNLNMISHFQAQALCHCAQTARFVSLMAAAGMQTLLKIAKSCIFTAEIELLDLQISPASGDFVP